MIDSKISKCFGEPILKNTLVVIECNSLYPINLSVRDNNDIIYSAGKHIYNYIKLINKIELILKILTLFSLDGNSIKTAFTTLESGPHYICIFNPNDSNIKTTISFKWGSETQDYTSIAKKEHIEPSKKILNDIIIALNDYQSSLFQIAQAESLLHVASESAYSRVIFFSILNIIVIIGINIIQTIYFKKFFSSRKLI
ncbi:uncharacterized protein CMU_035110 [Cryptosporidium muris RN66]|uniref:GOLD domain-containing protein n=1 Tax=Cryptosporidium muris (strain RN66) TaxID=441375 RepID=B6AFY4_CRYMR|nr:uncharacterized protein CMU_035110 [Cryptosporidium muris RN66]EEA07125.1 hypothetical protein CMU_035110 [Cryptosporidium muris RN66]|eukprot:XP_002141474.1 hypothetical protein [Cryptosporidium muris RN66]